MAAQTTNYRLNKPDRTDFVNIKEQLSDNLDIIDTEIKKAQDKADQAFQKADTSVNKNGTTAMDNLTVGNRKSGSTIGTNSLAEGINNEASGNVSHAEGESNASATAYAHTEGRYNLASNGTLFAITAFNDTNKTITLDNTTGLAASDKLDIKITGAAPLTGVTISAINGLVVTLSTTSTLSTYWTFAVKKIELPNSTHAENTDTLASGSSSHSEGYLTVASGNNSHAEGRTSKASGGNSHAEGNATTASGYQSHAEGNCTIASGDHSHAEGSQTTASGNSAHAEGIITVASAEYSHAEGYATQATNGQTHAEGYHTTASGNASHAEGQYTNAAGISSHAEGAYSSVLSGASYSHAEGTYTTALTEKMHVEGHLSTAGYSITYSITAFNDTAKTITLDNVTSLAVGDLLSIFRRDNSTKITLVNIPVSAISGLVVTLTTTEALDSSCLYALKKVSSLGLSSHAEGTNTLASGGHSHAEGVQTAAISSAAHAEGNQTIASGAAAHAEGVATIASGAYSHAEGGYSVASGNYSHVAGYSTIAQGPYQAVFGRYNSYNTTDLFQIGSGTSDAARNNVFAITGDGSQLNQMNPLATLTTQTLIDAYYNNYSASMPIRTHYDTAVNHNFVHTTLGGGIYYLQGLKVDSLYEWQEITSYSDTPGFRRWGRSKFNGTWTSWKSFS